MELVIEQEIPFPLERVEQVIVAPETWGNITTYIPSLKELKLIYREEVGTNICLRKWYVPDITVPWFAKGKIKPEMLEWGELFTWDPQVKHGDFLIEPNIPREWNKYFSCGGKYILKPKTQDSTVRIVTLDIRVSVPLFSAMAEGYVADRIKEWYKQEADALTILAAK